MSLLAKIERLEREASAKAKQEPLVDPELLAAARTLLDELSQPKTVEEQLARTRERIATLRHDLERLDANPPEPSQGEFIPMCADPFWLKVMLGLEEKRLAELEGLS